ncbi:flavodoxin, partial [uncultured Dubosiella sp.]
MKKIAGLMLSLVLAVSLAACQNTPAAKEERKEAKDDASIVVYFSATGNTKKIAEDIAQLTGANLFEIEPATPYTKADLAY